MNFDLDNIINLPNEYLTKMLNILQRTSERFDDTMPNAKTIIEIRITAFEDEITRRGL